MPKLSETQPRSVARLQQLALMRLQLRFTAETHRLYRALYKSIVTVIKAAADDDGVVDGVKLSASSGAVEGRWTATHRRWVSMFEAARRQAADIPFGALVVYHNAMFGPVTEVTEALTDAEAAIIRMWEARRQRALDTAAGRIYSDGFNLSQRVWRLEQDGLQDIRRTLATALTERTNASRLARTLEPLLGANQNCPRWTNDRLYHMTPRERLTDKTGLLRGDECNSTGMAYNALRMARNEIQIAHHLVNDELFRVSPWVTGEKIRTSPGHAEVDICDEYASGGPYQPGEVTLPLHIQCLCRKEAVTMPAADFRNQVRGWMRGENTFLDGYADWLGQTPTVNLSFSLAQTFEDWLESNPDAHAAGLGVVGG